MSFRRCLRFSLYSSCWADEALPLARVQHLLAARHSLRASAISCVHQYLGFLPGLALVAGAFMQALTNTLFTSFSSASAASSPQPLLSSSLRVSMFIPR